MLTEPWRRSRYAPSGIVDRFAGDRGEFRRVEAQEVEIALRLREGGAAAVDHLRIRRDSSSR